MTGIRELFPFGDLDEEVPRRMAARFPLVPVEEVTAAIALGRAMVAVIESMSATFESAGLSPARWRLLVALLAQAEPEGTTIGRLAEHLGVREPTMTATVDRAERDGLVGRHRDPADRRVVIVRLTDEGMRTVAQVLPVAAGRITAFVSAMGGAGEVGRLADRLTGAVDESTRT
jgi:DNA-binding MarR family transcriptional regulator